MLLTKDELTKINDYLSSLDNISISYPITKSIAVFSYKDNPYAYLDKGNNSDILWRLSLRCESRLASVLKQRYEEVLSGQKLNPKLWITLILSGQMTFDEIIDLINHSYQLAGGSLY